jgi:hypothetical protein
MIRRYYCLLILLLPMLVFAQPQGPDTSWVYHWGLNTTWDYLKQVRQTPDGGCVWTGYKINDVQPFGRSTVLEKLNRNGRVQWTQEYSDEDRMSGSAVLPTDRGYVFC